MIKRLFYLAFIALGITMAVPSLRAELTGFTQPYVDDLKGRFVPRKLRVMADQLDVRLGRGEGLPGGFDGWLRRYYSSSPEDPWGNFYYLVQSRRDYYVGSAGPDGVQGTEDDIREPARPLTGEGPRVPR